MDHILIVDDEKGFSKAMQMTLEGLYSVSTAENATEALRLVRHRKTDLVLLDIGLPDMSGIDLLTQLKSVEPDMAIIMVTAMVETKTVVNALRLGAHDYLVKPIDSQELKLSVRNGLESKGRKEPIQPNPSPDAERCRYDLIGGSAKMKGLVEVARKASKSVDTPVLVLGESGTGKGLLARAIHYNFSDAPGPFVTVNCTAISQELLESELFGYDRGAFTGAKSEGRRGRFEESAGGTILLDEIGSMALPSQAKLLGVLEDRMYYRVGGSRRQSVSSRIIAATNTDLEQAIEEGRFRPDLYYRLNVVKIKLPPLRERREDILPLAESFVDHFNRKFGKQFEGISPKARKALLSYHWPGNVRELRNTLERIILLEDGRTVLPEHLFFMSSDHDSYGPPAEGFGADGMDYDGVMTGLIREALKRTGGNVLEAAGLLNMPVHKMRYRIKKHQLRL